MRTERKPSPKFTIDQANDPSFGDLELDTRVLKDKRSILGLMS